MDTNKYEDVVVAISARIQTLTEIEFQAPDIAKVSYAELNQMAAALRKLDEVIELLK